jgi:hypothetical protein
VDVLLVATVLVVLLGLGMVSEPVGGELNN